MTVTATTNSALAGLAAGVARECPRGSVERRAGLCASVALGTTRNVAAARAALADSDMPVDIRTAAIVLLGELAAAAVAHV